MAGALSKGMPVFVREPSIAGHWDRAGQWLIAARAEAFSPGAALVVGVVLWAEGNGCGEEARAVSRAVPYRSVTTGPMKAIATHGTPWFRSAKGELSAGRMFHLSLIRADVQGRGLGGNIVHMFCVGQGVHVTLGLGSIDGEKGCVNIYR